MTLLSVEFKISKIISQHVREVLELLPQWPLVLSNIVVDYMDKILDCTRCEYTSKQFEELAFGSLILRKFSISPHPCCNVVFSFRKFNFYAKRESDGLRFYIQSEESLDRINVS